MACAMDGLQGFGFLPIPASTVAVAARTAVGEVLDGRWHESLWKEFFKDPLKQRDNRSGKRKPRQPDLEHKATKEPLWMDIHSNSPLVTPELIRHGLTVHPQSLGTMTSADAADMISPSLLWACCKTKDLSRGTRIHIELLERGLIEKNYSDALITMYAKCGEVHKAQALLDTYNSSSITPWTALIAGYVRGGKGKNALDCFEQMQHAGIDPNAETYASSLKACALIRAIDKGVKIHDEILRLGLLEHNIVLGTALIDMYAKCGAMSQAQSVLERLPSRRVGCWSALITGFARNGQGQEALACFEQMQHEGVSPNAVTYASILKGCALARALEEGKQIHDKISKEGLLKDDVVLGTALVDMYAKCGALHQAQCVLDALPSRDVVSWNALIAGYAQNDQAQQSLHCFEKMQGERICANAVTYMGVLKACAAIRAIDKGRQIHKEILRQGLLKHNIALGTTLVDMYAKCDALPEARRVLRKLPFRDVVCWSALITGYADNGQGQQALACFEELKQESILPNSAIYVGVLRACAIIGALDKGKQIHNDIWRQGLLEHDIVLGTALLDMYAKCGALSQAQNVLNKLPSRDPASWNALIGGFAQKGQTQLALECFERMQQEGILPDTVTFHCVLNLCSHLGLVEMAEEVFDSMEAMYGVNPDLECFTCMVDLLGRVGNLVKAAEVIQRMPFSATSYIWHCLLGACQKLVDVDVGIWAFEQAVELDARDGAAYILMINIYVAAGMADKAKGIEAMMRKKKA